MLAFVLHRAYFMRRFIVTLLAILTLSGCGMPGLITSRLADEDASGDALTSDEFTVVFIDVGQGDATLIKAPSGEAILIDAGPWEASSTVISAIHQAGVAELSAIIATHYHADHIGGIPAVIAEYPTEVIYDRGHSYGEYSPAYENYVEAAASVRMAVDPCDRIHVGEVVLQTVAANGEVCGGPSAEIGDDENAASLAFVVEHGDLRMFIGGDLTGGGGYFPYNTPDVESLVADIVGDVDVLKVSHHGSYTSTNQTFLDTLQPEIAVISCGDDNDHDHPHSLIVDRLLQSGTALYQTEQCSTENDMVRVANGNIVLNLDANGGISVSL